MSEASYLKSSPRPLRVSKIAWLALLLLCFGCRETARNQPSQRTASIASSASSAVTPGPLTPMGLARIVSALKQRLGKLPSLLSAELFSDHATFQVESPDAAGKLSQYEWRAGELAGPFPVEVRGTGSVEQNLFSFSLVDWTNIPDLLYLARSRVDPENGRVTRVLVRRGLPRDESVAIRVYVESPVRSGYVDADGRGRLLDPSRAP